MLAGAALGGLLSSVATQAQTRPADPVMRAAPVSSPARAAPVSSLVRAVDIPFQQFTLPNGLRVIVHTDRKAPIVAVSVWYGVGSKDEPAGRTGFAHLFEHLMFNGSENSDREFFEPLEEVGATDYNGTTYFDRTNYFQNVPTPALERALFLESDRMGHLLGAVTQAKIDNQRSVVQNEKRQRANDAYGLVEYAQLEGLFPGGHPYRHSPVGSMADLNAATLDDVKTWFRTNYGPNNAVLVLAGDVDLRTARPLVERYFGDIPRAATPIRTTAGVPDRRETTRRTMPDAVPNARLYRSWAIPGRNDADMPLLDIASAVLAGGSTSRLYNDLVRDKKLAVSVGGGASDELLAGTLQLTVDVRPGVDPAMVEARLDELLNQFLREGPTADEVGRVSTRFASGVIQGLEQVGGFTGKAGTLAEGALYANDPAFYKTTLRRYATATPAAVKAAAARWMADGDFRLAVVPGTRTPEDVARAGGGVGGVVAGGGVTPGGPLHYQTPGQARPVLRSGAVDRSKLPDVKGFPKLDFPNVERTRLSNGIQVEFARRTTVPVVRMAMSFDAGYASDPRDKLGLASLAASLLDEGTNRRTAIQIGEEMQRLGGSIGTAAGPDRTRVALTALTPNLAPSLDIFADVLRNATFPPAEIERLKTVRAAQIAQEQAQPILLAIRELPPLLYGPQHPYGVPLTGSGTTAAVAGITRDDVVAYRDRWLRPDNATLFVVGDTTLAQLTPMLERSFAGWRPPAAPKGVKTFTAVAPPAASRIIILDRPGAPQSFILGGTTLRSRGVDDLLAFNVANDVLGGGATSRLNTDLRETKGWAYGAQSTLIELREQSPFIALAPVQTDRTADSVKAIIDNIRAYNGATPATPTELARAINNRTRSLPGSFETGSAVLGALESNDLLERPDDYQERLADRVRALVSRDLVAASGANIDPARMIWLVVGDRAKIEAPLRALNLGTVEVSPAK